MGGISESKRWLKPGLGVKRWLVMILLGTTLIAVGLAFFLLELYRTAPEGWWSGVLSTASLRFLDRPVRIIVFGILGLGLFAIGIWELNRSLMSPYLRPGSSVVDTLRTFRQREKGPRIVAVGGGHGLATLLRGLKHATHNLTAVVTVADDGGSSGRLRREMNILPPGDVRNCLAALSNDEALLGQLFQYRFPDGEPGLEGHSFGNLFIVALSEITGSFEKAVAESGRVLAVQGRVLPSTVHDVRLVADVVLPYAVNEVRVEGESRIPAVEGNVRRVWLEPNTPPAFPDAVKAILSAELIVVGPGSLYTSILPNLLVPDLAAAIQVSRALKVFICNIATQPGETDHYSCGDHIRAIERHVGTQLFNVIVCNQRYEGKLFDGTDWVKTEPGLEKEYSLYCTDLIDTLHPWRHDSQKLAKILIDLYQERTGPLVE